MKSRILENDLKKYRLVIQGWTDKEEEILMIQNFRSNFPPTKDELEPIALELLKNKGKELGKEFIEYSLGLICGWEE